MGEHGRQHGDVAQHQSLPGTPVDRFTLIEATWPGEQVEYEAGNNRLYVTLWKVRQLGLEEDVVTTDDGYMLDPDLQVVHDERTSPQS